MFPKPTRSKRPVRHINRKTQRAKKSEFGGILFDSRGETGLYALLKLLERSGEIQEVRMQPNVHLTDAKILMIPDFVVFDMLADRDIYHEYKGVETAVWRIKRRLWKCYGPAPLKCWAGYGKTLSVYETIDPATRRITKG